MGKEHDVLDYVLANAPAGDPDAIILTVDEYRKGGISMMNLGAEKGRIVEEAVAGVGADRILELGSYFGYSATRMARQLKNGGALTTIDADDERHRVSSEFVAHAGLSDRITLLLGRAEEMIPTVQGPFDFVLIDHYAENYLSDLQLIESLGLLRAGTIVAADNVVAHRPTVDTYLDHVRSSGLYDSTLHKVGRDGVEISVWQGA